MHIIQHPEHIHSTHTDLCKQIVAHLGDKYSPTHIVFDTNDYSGQRHLIGEFNDIAFTWTRDRPRDDVPEYFFDITDDSSCTHVVWLSHRTIVYAPPLFAWVFAHELRHVFQSRGQFPRNKLRIKIEALRRLPEYIRLQPSLFTLEEIDSELSAARVLAALYGEDELSSFLASTELPRCPYPEYANFLQALKAATQNDL